MKKRKHCKNLMERPRQKWTCILKTRWILFTGDILSKCWKLFFFFQEKVTLPNFTSTWNLMNKSGLLTFRSGSMAPTVKNLELSCWLSTTVTLYGSLWNCGGWSLMTWIVTTATPSFPLGSLAITSNCKIIHNGKYIHSFFFLF